MAEKRTLPEGASPLNSADPLYDLCEAAKRRLGERLGAEEKKLAEITVAPHTLPLISAVQAKADTLRIAIAIIQEEYRRWSGQ